MNNTEVITEMIAAAAIAAILEHKRIGNPIATWRDGKVVIVQPADIGSDGDWSICATGHLHETPEHQPV
jgi:hypothetical protein